MSVPAAESQGGKPVGELVRRGGRHGYNPATMSYQVLARKWRPKQFGELVGQPHVVRAITHALDSGRLHHAYLFTGTRGVGKTTIARILAKSLNCEAGVSSTPCGKCSACTEIDAGRFVDLLEVDAATNTRVDEMRQLLENAVYAPTRGRYKVYVIDEVHMLSNSAFNAMLKTLEEPPEHVKFVLATTDPQKIPVTVLSRCLQFGLKQVPAELVWERLRDICVQEQVAAEADALKVIAAAARGSMRDALSLLDQAIAFSASNVTAEAVRSMIGSIDQGYLMSIVERIAGGDLHGAVAMADEIQARSLSFDDALRGIAAILHRIALVQAAPELAADGVPVDAERVANLAQAVDAESLQVLYQVAIHGRAELALAPDEYAGFTMTLVRMACFQPGTAGEGAERPRRGPVEVAERPAQPSVAPRQAAPRSAAGDAVRAGPMPTKDFAGDWPGLVRDLKLTGLARQLAERAELVRFENGRFELAIGQPDRALSERAYVDRLRAALQQALGGAVAVNVSVGDTSGTSVAALDAAARASRTKEAEQSMQADTFVRELVADFDATIESIKPVQ